MAGQMTGAIPMTIWQTPTEYHEGYFACGHCAAPVHRIITFGFRTPKTYSFVNYPCRCEVGVIGDGERRIYNAFA